MVTYFISDLHLSEQRPDIIQAFLTFLESKACQADALYILGDLFEFWIGDDDQTPVAIQVAEALSRLAAHGTPCYYIHGNRDFMLGQAYANQAKMILLEEETTIDLYGKKVLLLHGDTLCTDDEGYQEYRKVTQKRWLRKLFLMLPLMLRQVIANKIRGDSKASKKNKSLSIMDVNQEAVEQRLSRIDYMIHGHTHRPATHYYPDYQCYRIVLGDWYQQASILSVEPQQLLLRSGEQEEHLDFA